MSTTNQSKTCRNTVHTYVVISMQPFLENLPDALEHDCAGCSEVQKNMADKISHHLIDNKPDDWKLLEDKYDPTGAYRRRYLENKSKEEGRLD